ncbi:diiron oxygenase [Dactylosporangium sp. CA-139114]|uniref:diiron oxygenase n=1 Tax=Dactylosporangium sp. CA-139114 TaxID=3239931 RepID=UPI003D96D2F9
MVPVRTRESSAGTARSAPVDAPRDARSIATLAWPHIDGRRSVADLAALLEQRGAGTFRQLAHSLSEQLGWLVEAGEIELVRAESDNPWKSARATLVTKARAPQREPQDSAAPYRSGFAGWYERASVRSKPRRMLEGGEPVYFSPELVPIAAHPLVLERGEQAVRQILVHRLFTYLHFTTELEQVAVLPVASAIARGRAGIDLPEQMRSDAYKIVTDEAWHAQFSYDLVRQVEAETGIHLPELPLPAFIGRLDTIASTLPDRMRGLTALLFCIVSETLISAILSDLPRDSRLPSAVREVVRDHAVDEGRHHTYFKDMLSRLWPELSVAEQRIVGPAVPQIIDAFLRPDLAALVPGLTRIGLTAEECRGVIAESTPEHLIRRDIAAAARPATRYFTEVGALDHSRTREAFESAGLL